MRRNPRLWVAGFIALAAVAGGFWAIMAQAEEASKSVVETKTAKGLHFKLPHDWPIEERGGVVGPIPIEEYLARKFDTLDKRLQSIEQQTVSFDLRLRVLEEKVKQQQQQGLRSGETLP